MQALPRTDTKPERALRSALHSLGLRFRAERRLIAGLRRTVDIVFPGAKVACFVHGCFWHGCTRHLKWPSRNAEFWRAKIERNKAKDRDTVSRLRRAGWTVIVCWEHEDPGRAADRVASRVRARTAERHTPRAALK